MAPVVSADMILYFQKYAKLGYVGSGRYLINLGSAYK